MTIHAATTGNTFAVNLSDDRADANPGDGVCSVVNFGAFCSLRAAMQEANATDAPDVINFDVGTGPDGIATISPQSALPTITAPVIIDGYTQTGAQKNTRTVGNNAVLKIELDGSMVSTPNVFGLSIRNSSGSVIRGLNIHDFTEGVDIRGTSTSGNHVEGNFIGTDKSGTKDFGNHQYEVEDISSSGNTISGNKGSGLIVSGNSNKVLGNRIGTTASGSAPLANASGIRIEGFSFDNLIGDGTVAGSNQTFVVSLYSNPAGGNEGKRFLGQRSVGTDGSGKSSFTKALAKVSVGKTITATATSAGGDTSEFSLPRKVVSA